MKYPESKYLYALKNKENIFVNISSSYFLTKFSSKKDEKIYKIKASFTDEKLDKKKYQVHFDSNTGILKDIFYNDINIISPIKFPRICIPCMPPPNYITLNVIIEDVTYDNKINFSYVFNTWYTNLKNKYFSWSTGSTYISVEEHNEMRNTEYTYGKCDEKGFSYVYRNGIKTNTKVLLFSKEEIEKLHKCQKEIYEGRKENN